MSALENQIARNLAEVRQRIAAAARRAGREPESVRLAAVTKYVSVEAARAVAKAGIIDLAESRPQELWSKAVALSDLGVRWHLIGHLQRNKVRRTLPYCFLIHSVDSERLLEALQAEAQGLGRSVSALLEVKTAADAAKQGLAVDEVEPLLGKLPRFPQVEVRGLMTMAPREGGESAARPCFRRLRELRDRLTKVAPASVSLTELSMGMSGDYEAAVEEGATIVRVGSALFEGVAE